MSYNSRTVTIGQIQFSVMIDAILDGDDRLTSNIPKQTKTGNVN